MGLSGFSISSSSHSSLCVASSGGYEGESYRSDSLEECPRVIIPIGRWRGSTGSSVSESEDESPDHVASKGCGPPEAESSGVGNATVR